MPENKSVLEKIGEIVNQLEDICYTNNIAVEITFNEENFRNCSKIYYEL